ncbi:Mediator of RNA polymerase II transcription subunit 7 [Blyttiomyces sp. JEL0837]|nr:Mediator of RNA polymerase II transcription subunit 7 [Blyttiomyces sp. JEL0837]
MAQPGSSALPALALQYPPPPPFYTLYTDENIKAHEERQKRKETTKGLNPTELVSESIDPFEHQDSQPVLFLDPPPPIAGNYTMFGETLSTIDKIPTLQELGIKQLVSDDPAELNHTLIHRPREFAKKLDDIRLIVINMHYLLSSYRPHQARDTLRLMLQQHIKRRKDTTEELQKCLEQVENTFRLRRDSIISPKVDAPLMFPLPPSNYVIPPTIETQSQEPEPSAQIKDQQKAEASRTRRQKLAEMALASLSTEKVGDDNVDTMVE